MNEIVEITNGAIPESLVNREIQRKKEIERKRLEKEQSASTIEAVQFFHDTFMEKQEEIEQILKDIKAGIVEKAQLPEYFDAMNRHLLDMQHYIASSTPFLRVYDLRKAKEMIQLLQQRCQDMEDLVLPKKKFGFKVRKRPSAKLLPQKIEDVVDSVILASPYFPGEVHDLTGRVGEVIVLPAETVLHKDVVLSDLEDCIVKLLGAPSTLHVTSLRGCRVMCGPVSTSVFVDTCEDCTLVLPCQQLRVHNTRRTNFYLHVTSRAIIEDSTQVGFAPFNWHYEGLDKHFEVAGLDQSRNNWHSVDDFNWLVSDQPSPNWHVIQERDRKVAW